jgi:phosphopantetheine--protein transferase-like protein
MYRHALSKLFPKNVATADLWDLTAAGPLHAEETADSARMGPKRRREFTAGRDCGRRALGRLGFSHASIPRTARGLPCWPTDTVGSITHTDDYAAAVAAKQADYMGVGIDAERIGRLTPNLWRRVFTKTERAWLAGLNDAEQQTFATVIFSAKEAFYKAQFMAFGARLGFQDVTVAVHTDTFHVCSSLGITAFQGAFTVVQDKVLTAALLPRAH